MAVYTGQVSHKNGLGRVRNVTATDNMALAIAFGIDGSIGSAYSNGKIGMLQLEGEAPHNEVAIDPSEMTRIQDIDYARNNIAKIVNFGALANAISRDNRTELVSALQRVAPRADFVSLTDDARGEVVKLVLGVGDAKRAKEIIGNSNAEQALLDTIKRNAVAVHYSANGETGGVAFSVTARGTTSVLVQKSRKLISVKILVTGSVSGSASNAGSKYKQNFVDIKKSVVRLAETESIDRNMQFDPEEDIEATASNIRTLLSQTARDIVRRSIRNIEDQYASVENFNPASVKARIWNELNLTTTDVPQTKLDEAPLRQYANGEITAVEFAEMPENGMVAKLMKSVARRLENADFDAFAERVVDAVAPTLKGQDRNELINKVYPIVEQVTESLADSVSQGVTKFEDAYELYTRPNRVWELEIIRKVTPQVDVPEPLPVNVQIAQNNVEDRIKNDLEDAVTRFYSDSKPDIIQAREFERQIVEQLTSKHFDPVFDNIKTEVSQAKDEDTAKNITMNFLNGSAYRTYASRFSSDIVDEFAKFDVHPTIKAKSIDVKLVQKIAESLIKPAVATTLYNVAQEHKIMLAQQTITQVVNKLSLKYLNEYADELLNNDDLKRTQDIAQVTDVVKNQSNLVLQHITGRLEPDVTEELNALGLLDQQGTKEQKEMLVHPILESQIQADVSNEVMLFNVTHKLGDNGRQLGKEITAIVTEKFVNYGLVDLERPLELTFNADESKDLAHNYLLQGKYAMYGDAISREIESQYRTRGVDPQVSGSDKESIARDEMSIYIRGNLDMIIGQFIAENQFTIDQETRLAILDDVTNHMIELTIDDALNDEAVESATTIQEVRTAVKNFLQAKVLSNVLASAEPVIADKVSIAQQGNYIPEDDENALHQAIQDLVDKAYEKFVNEIGYEPAVDDGIFTEIVDAKTSELKHGFFDEVKRERVLAIDLAPTFAESHISDMFLTNEIRRLANVDALIVKETDNLVAEIIADSKYARGDKTFWFNAVRRVVATHLDGELKLLHEGIADHDNFIDVYLPDWKESAGV